jgi:hypothetical protein
MIFWIDELKNKDVVRVLPFNSLCFDDECELNAMADTRHFINGYVYVGF